MPPFQPHTALGRRLRELLAWLWHQEGSHGQRGRGLAAGLFCGCYPFFGLTILGSVALPSLVRGNHLLAAAGNWVGNPFTYVPLYWYNYQVGCWLLGPGRDGPVSTASKTDGSGATVGRSAAACSWAPP